MGDALGDVHAIRCVMYLTARIMQLRVFPAFLMIEQIFDVNAHIPDMQCYSKNDMTAKELGLEARVCIYQSSNFEMPTYSENLYARVLR